VPVKSILYDANGNEVADEALAVRGVTAEVDDDGNVVQELESWAIEEKALRGDIGELATRPRADDDEASD
jgi:hypothetical protein